MSQQSNTVHEAPGNAPGLVPANAHVAPVEGISQAAGADSANIGDASMALSTTDEIDTTTSTAAAVHNLPVSESSSPSRKLIVVLGASYSGVSLTHYLLKHVVPALSGSYQLVLVSPSNEIVARPAMPRAMLSDDLLDQSKLFVKVTTVLAQYPEDTVRFLHGTAIKLNHGAKNVTIRPAVDSALNSGTEMLEYHALIIATGASTNSPLLGLTTDSEALRASWASLRAALPTAKTIVIAGGGPAGIETAGEIGHHLNGKAGMFKKTIGTPKVAITVVNGSERILPVLRPALATKAELLLAKLGVTVRNNLKVTAVEPAASGSATSIATKTVVRLNDGTTIDADIYIPATGWNYNTSFVDASLLNAEHRVIVNGDMFRVNGAGDNAMVYAIGDASAAHRPAVHLILDAVPVCANAIKRDLLRAEGKPEAELPADKPFAANAKEMQLVPIGKTMGVGAVMGFKVPGFFVKMIKGRDYFLWTTPKLWSGQQWAKA